MRNSNQAKNDKNGQKKSSSDFVYALRASGMLLPITDEETKSFNSIHGELNEELPDRFKNLDFIFDKVKKIEIPSVSIEPSEDIKIAYAARDGQENLPDHILKQMKELKNQARKKNTKNSKK